MNSILMDLAWMKLFNDEQDRVIRKLDLAIYNTEEWDSLSDEEELYNDLEEAMASRVRNGMREYLGRQGIQLFDDAHHDWL